MFIKKLPAVWLLRSIMCSALVFGLAACSSSDDDAVAPPVDGGTDGGTDNNCNGIVDYQEVVFKYGDINRSERIDVADLRIVLIEFGGNGASAADINHDRTVDSNDLDQMLDTYDTLTYGF